MGEYVHAIVDEQISQLLKVDSLSPTHMTRPRLPLRTLRPQHNACLSLALTFLYLHTPLSHLARCLSRKANLMWAAQLQQFAQAFQQQFVQYQQQQQQFVQQQSLTISHSKKMPNNHYPPGPSYNDPRAQNAARGATIAAREASLAEMKREREELRTEVADLKEEVQSLNLSLQKTVIEKDATIASHLDRNARLGKKLSTMVDQTGLAEHLNKEVDKLRTEREKMLCDLQIKTLQLELKDKESSTQTKEPTDKIKELNDREKELKAEIKTLAQEGHVFESHITKLEEKNLHLETAQQQLLSEIIALKNKNTEVENQQDDQNKKLNEQCETLRSDYKELVHQYTDLRFKNSQLRTKIKELEKDQTPLTIAKEKARDLEIEVGMLETEVSVLKEQLVKRDVCEQEDEAASVDSGYGERNLVDSLNECPSAMRAEEMIRMLQGRP